MKEEKIEKEKKGLKVGEEQIYGLLVADDWDGEMRWADEVGMKMMLMLMLRMMLMLMLMLDEIE